MPKTGSKLPDLVKQQFPNKNQAKRILSIAEKRFSGHVSKDFADDVRTRYNNELAKLGREASLLKPTEVKSEIIKPLTPGPTFRGQLADNVATTSATKSARTNILKVQDRILNSTVAKARITKNVTDALIKADILDTLRTGVDQKKKIYRSYVKRKTFTFPGFFDITFHNGDYPLTIRKYFDSKQGLLNFNIFDIMDNGSLIQLTYEERVFAEKYKVDGEDITGTILTESFKAVTIKQLPTVGELKKIGAEAFKEKLILRGLKFDILEGWNIAKYDVTDGSCVPDAIEHLYNNDKSRMKKYFKRQGHRTFFGNDGTTIERIREFCRQFDISFYIYDNLGKHIEHEVRHNGEKRKPLAGIMLQGHFYLCDDKDASKLRNRTTALFSNKSNTKKITKEPKETEELEIVQCNVTKKLISVLNDKIMPDTSKIRLRCGTPYSFVHDNKKFVERIPEYNDRLPMAHNDESPSMDRDNTFLEILNEKFSSLKCERTSIDEETRNKVKRRDNNKCQNKDCPNDCDIMEVDHIIPVGLGGDNDTNNLQILCRNCNLRKIEEMNPIQSISSNLFTKELQAIFMDSKLGDLESYKKGSYTETYNYDVSKHYMSVMESIDYLPRFDFDSSIKELPKDFDDFPASSIAYGTIVNPTAESDFILRFRKGWVTEPVFERLTKLGYKFLFTHYCECKEAKNIFKDVFKSLFEKFDEKTAKQIGNVAIGKYIRKFHDKFPDKVDCIGSQDEVKCFAEDKSFLNEIIPGTFISWQTNEQIRYQNNLPVWYTLQTLARVTMLEHHVKLGNNTNDLVGVHVDCLIYKSRQNDSHLSSKKCFGKLKQAEIKYYTKSYNNYKLQDTELYIEPPMQNVNGIPTETSCFVSGMAGVGKTYTATSELAKTGMKVLRLAPTNKASRIVDGQTIHSFLSMNSNKISQMKQVKLVEKCNLYDAVLIDEISMIPLLMWKELFRMKLIKPSLKFYLVGDPNQLLPVETNKEKDGYYNYSFFRELCNSCHYHREYNPTECRGDREIQELLVKCLSRNIDLKYIDDIVGDLPTCDKFEFENNISFTNNTRKEINNHWVDKLGLKKIICHTTFKHNKETIACADQFNVIENKNDKIICNDITISRDDYNKYFEPAYCATNHKLQGSKIDGKFCIHTEGMTRRMIYTAIGRAVKYTDIHVN